MSWRGEEEPGSFFDLIYGDDLERLVFGGEEIVGDDDEEDEELADSEEVIYEDDDVESELDASLTQEQNSEYRSPSPPSEEEDGRRSRSPLRLAEQLPSPLVKEECRSRSPMRIYVEERPLIRPGTSQESDTLKPKILAIYDAMGRPLQKKDLRKKLKLKQKRCRSPVWTIGDPITEVFKKDEDLPESLILSVMNIEKSREARFKREAVQKYNDSDSDDEIDDTFLKPEEMQFEWCPMDTFQSQEEIFSPEHTGATKNVLTPYEAFRLFWDDKILQLIAEETNKHAMTIESPSFRQEWYNTNSHEILCLFAFWMMLGIIRVPSIKSCFSSNALLKIDVFRSIFSYRRFLNLTRALHFIDANSRGKNADRLFRLRPICDHLNKTFKANYIPKQQVCIDESLTMWKGRVLFKQYVKTKKARFGIKTYELCESTTGYLWSFTVYTGKDNSLEHDQTQPKSTQIVVNLMKPLLNKGYQLYLDNWYNSPALARFLKRNGTDCIGTLRPTRKNVPVLIQQALLKKGQMVARHSGDICVMAWQDKRRVTTLSTCHGIDTGYERVLSRVTTRPLHMKPQVILNYNRNMGGVDLKDQMLEPYLIERKGCFKWYMKLFKRLLNCSILNARILLESSFGRRCDHLEFRLGLVNDILKVHIEKRPLSKRLENVKKPLDNTGHWPALHVQRQSDILNRKKTTQRCHICSKEGRKTRKTPYKCEACNISLCANECFKKYHLNLSKTMPSSSKL